MNEVEEIKEKIEIADLMSEYIKLIPAGTNFKALCPFHNEKTPSMMISPEKKIFKCFGCGAGGDVFEFLMKIEGLEFIEAKKFLAKKAGVALSDYNLKENSQKSRLLDVMDLARKYYHYVLLHSDQAKPAREYLAGRGLDEETIIDWQIGYSPDSWNSLCDFLKSKKFSDQEIFLAGLTAKKKVGVGFYDRFRGRIMFPINDVNGNFVGFTARVSPEKEATEKMGKYINSPQTDIYDKSRIVFGLDKAKRFIKQDDKVIITEGQMDVITAHKNGFCNVVASSGTALTLDQFKLIKRYTNNFLFALDADLAGQNATNKGDTLAKVLDLYVVELEDSYGRKKSYVDPQLSYNMSVRVVEVKGAKDPDELIKKDPEAWRMAVDNAKPIIEYYFDRAIAGVDINDVGQQLNVVRKLLPEINKLNNKVEKDHWLKSLSQKLSISEDILREEMSKMPGVVSNNNPRFEPKNIVKNNNLSKDLELFRRILALIIKNPSLLSKVIHDLSDKYLYNAISLDLYKRIMLFYTNNVDSLRGLSVDNSQMDFFSSLRKQLIDNNSNKEVIDLLDESFLLSEKDFSNLSEREFDIELENTIKVLKGDYLNAKINLLKRDLEDAERRIDKERIDEIYAELTELLKQKK